METNHTPGPWKVFYPEANRLENKDQFVIGNKEQPVAIVPVLTDRPLEETESNAKLIASAPELLEALIKIDEKLRLNYTHTDISELKEMIISTIKKAT